MLRSQEEGAERVGGPPVLNVEALSPNPVGFLQDLDVLEAPLLQLVGHVYPGWACSYNANLVCEASWPRDVGKRDPFWFKWGQHLLRQALYLGSKKC